MLDLARSVSTMSGYTVRDCQEIIRWVTPALIKAVLDGEDIQICGGRFTKKTRAAHEARNPATGEAIQIPDKDYMHFKASPKLKKVMLGEESYEVFIPIHERRKTEED